MWLKPRKFNDSPMSLPQLKQQYKRFGFIEDSDMMVREPLDKNSELLYN